MDLSTRYLGLALRNPLVASASPLSNTANGVHRLADSGVGAVVLYSLFEEQVRREAAANAALADAGTESFAGSLSYFPAAADASPGPRRYLSLLERAAAAVDIPVIASLNGVTTGGWTDYASALEQAGAAARPGRGGRPGPVQPVPPARHRSGDADRDRQVRPVQRRRRAPAAGLDRPAGGPGARQPGGDHRRRDRGRRGQVPAGRRGRGDDRLGAAPARPRVRGRAA